MKPEDLESLIEQYQDRIYRFGMRLCRDPEDAREVLQETLLTLARGIDDFRGEASLSTWLYTVARSHCIKKRRRSKFAPEQVQSFEHAEESAGVPADDRSDPEALASAREVGRALQLAIDDLDDASREVLLLRDVEGLTAPEVAEVTGVSASAVKSRLHRARMAVRDRVAPLLNPTPPTTTAQESCPDVLMQFSKHLEGDISASTCAELERHLEQCPRCRGACDSLRQTLSMCETAGRAVKVPKAVQASVKVALRDFLAQR
jgi:RNA polymerase sigma-70 factor (ECF subfamily)